MPHTIHAKCLSQASFQASNVLNLLWERNLHLSCFKAVKQHHKETQGDTGVTPSVMQQLIDAGGSLDATDRRGWTVLSMQAQKETAVSCSCCCLLVPLAQKPCSMPAYAALEAASRSGCCHRQALPGALARQDMNAASQAVEALAAYPAAVSSLRQCCRPGRLTCRRCSRYSNSEQESQQLVVGIAGTHRQLQASAQDITDTAVQALGNAARFRVTRMKLFSCLLCACKARRRLSHGQNSVFAVNGF